MGVLDLQIGFQLLRFLQFLGQQIFAIRLLVRRGDRDAVPISRSIPCSDVRRIDTAPISDPSAIHLGRRPVIAGIDDVAKFLEPHRQDGFARVVLVEIESIRFEQLRRRLGGVVLELSQKIGETESCRPIPGPCGSLRAWSG